MQSPIEHGRLVYGERVSKGDIGGRQKVDQVLSLPGMVQYVYFSLLLSWQQQLSTFYTVTLSKAIFLDRKNRESAIKEARQAAEDIHKKRVRQW